MHVFSVGGSLLAPDTLSPSYLIDFVRFFGKQEQSLFVVGGGRPARQYYEQLHKSALELHIGRLCNVSAVGTAITHANAQALLTLLLSAKISTYPCVLPNARELFDIHKYQCAVAAGYYPNRSSDFDAVMLAKRYGVSRIINLTNVKGVYDKDPKDSTAILQEKLTWEEFLSLMPDWDNGGHAPFDPIAGRLAQIEGIDVVVLDGSDWANLASFLQGERFVGTLLSNSF